MATMGPRAVDELGIEGMMSLISQTEHRKLITICSEIVETRRLPSP
jgi:hypothetical protein